ncbi:MAG: hypothetical protein ABSB90_03880 [Thermoplasmata archaeon]
MKGSLDIVETASLSEDQELERIHAEGSKGLSVPWMVRYPGRSRRHVSPHIARSRPGHPTLLDVNQRVPLRPTGDDEVQWQVQLRSNRGSLSVRDPFESSGPGRTLPSKERVRDTRTGQDGLDLPEYCGSLGEHPIPPSTADPFHLELGGVFFEDSKVLERPFALKFHLAQDTQFDQRVRVEVIRHV